MAVGRSAREADQDPARDDEAGADDEAPADAFDVAKERAPTTHAPERLGRDERCDDARACRGRTPRTGRRRRARRAGLPARMPATTRRDARRRATRTATRIVADPATSVALIASSGETSASTATQRTNVSRSAKASAPASANTRPIVLTCSGRPDSLASTTPPPTIRIAPSSDACRERLVEEHGGERDGEQRRHADGRRCARGPGVADRQREEDLGHARPENAREREWPHGGDVVVAGDRALPRARRRARADREQRTAERVVAAGERRPERHRHRAEERRRAEREDDGVHQAGSVPAAARATEVEAAAGSASRIPVSITAQPAQPRTPSRSTSEQHAE